MQAKDFDMSLAALGADFYTGVPDSLLSPFTNYIMEKHGVSTKHVVAANEGAAVGLAAGVYLSTGRPAVVYMQNSGIGNAVNPICSLLHKKVYAIPVIFVIGWRGEPGVKDEPQHVFQGEVTLTQLDNLGIPHAIITKDTTVDELLLYRQQFESHIAEGIPVAFVVKKDALEDGGNITSTSNATLSREEALEVTLARSTANDVFVCTTGKLSREVFELREKLNMGHGQDFLSVGSMGHSLMVAYGIALNKPSKRVYCLDGDGAVLMHMGSMGIVGVSGLKNIVHVVINNGAHETVGGIPTVASAIQLQSVATALEYPHAFRVSNSGELAATLEKVKSLAGPVFIEILTNLASRKDLGRPTTTPVQNRDNLMAFLAEADR